MQALVLLIITALHMTNCSNPVLEGEPPVSEGNQRIALITSAIIKILQPNCAVLYDVSS